VHAAASFAHLSPMQPPQSGFSKTQAAPASPVELVPAELAPPEPPALVPPVELFPAVLVVPALAPPLPPPLESSLEVLLHAVTAAVPKAKTATKQADKARIVILLGETRNRNGRTLKAPTSIQLPIRMSARYAYMCASRDTIGSRDARFHFCDEPRSGGGSTAPPTRFFGSYVGPALSALQPGAGPAVDGP